MQRQSLAFVLAMFTMVGYSADRSPADDFAAKPAGQEPRYDPTDNYVEQQIEGWRVLVNKRLLVEEQQELREKTLKLLDDHLYQVTRVVPADALKKLREVPIWVELAHPRHPCMCYHPSADWLHEHNMNPEKAGAVEIANCKNFLSWTIDQPWMVLHELAHAYHHRVLGHNNAELKDCFRRAAESKSYEYVLHIRGDRRRHYALKIDQEYFAEATEAYFGTNDYYSFVRADFKHHDPELFNLLENLWTKPPKD